MEERGNGWFYYTKKTAMLIMLITLVLQAVFSPIVAIAETVTSQESDTNIKQLKITENDENSAVIKVKVALNNVADEDQTYILSTNLPVKLAADSQNTTDTAVTANNQQVAIKTKAQTKRDLSLKLEVTKASSDEQIF